MIGIICLLLAFQAQFGYDASAPLDLQENTVTSSGGVRVHDLTYLSPLGGRIPAYLVLPASKGPFAAVLYGHWMMRGSPYMNRREFLEEAIVLAQSGAASLLIDAPFVRPGFIQQKGTLESAVQGSEAARQQVIDFRRGIDLLLKRKDIDAHRIAYVGHSFDAHVGALLAAAEKRISVFVLMAGSYADEENTFASKDRAVLQVRKEVGDARIRQYFREYAWDDPWNSLPNTSPAKVFLQFGSQDHDRAQDELAFQRCGDPKQIRFYDAGHALNNAATRDRLLWLAKELHLLSLDEAAIRTLRQMK